MTIAFLKSNDTKKRKRKGRGNASGLGGECGRGHKGQKSRSGFSRRAGFEGGQTPLYRRLPKLNGFNNSLFSTKYDVVNLEDLSNLDLDEVDVKILTEKKLVSGKNMVKVLGNGTISKKMKISAHKISKAAKEKVLKLKGEFVEISK